MTFKKTSSVNGGGVGGVAIDSLELYGHTNEIANSQLTKLAVGFKLENITLLTQWYVKRIKQQMPK